MLFIYFLVALHSAYPARPIKFNPGVVQPNGVTLVTQQAPRGETIVKGA